MSTRWNYQVVEIKPTGVSGFFGLQKQKQESLQAELARHGQLGWELVQVLATAPMAPLMAIFKREA